MTEKLIGLDPLPPVVPPRGPLEQWLAERNELFDLIRHASSIITETRSLIWEKPDGARTEIPGRAVVGDHSDPTGDTTADPRRIHLRQAIQSLTHDHRRDDQWSELIHAGNGLLLTRRLPLSPLVERPPAEPSVHAWVWPRSRILAHLTHLSEHAPAITAHDPTPFTRLARRTRRANLHLEQKVRRAAIQFDRYHGETDP